MPAKLLIAIILVLTIPSCSKKDSKPKDTSAWKIRLQQCDCINDSTEYIRGYFNDTYICFNSSYGDTFSNGYYIDTAIQLDQLNMIRQNSTNTMSCQLYLCNTNLHNQKLPYTIPHPNLAYCENAQITLLDFTQPWASACQGCDNDDADYFAISWYGFTLTVTDTTGGYLKGTFKGRISTKTGNWIYVDKGEFNIRVIDVIKHNQLKLSQFPQSAIQ